MKENEVLIGPTSRMSFATAATVVAAAISVTAMFVSIKLDIADMRRHVNTDWTFHDMEVWTTRLADFNRSNIVVPDPRILWKPSGQN